MRHSSDPRAKVGRVLLAVLASMAPSAAGAEILVVSQNALHLGWASAHHAEKTEFVRRLATWSGSPLPRLTFLQEVMKGLHEAEIQPSGSEVYFGNLKGTSTYRERYATVIVDVPADHIDVICRIDTAPLVTSGIVLERAPDATLIRDTSSGSEKLIWFLNFHSVFGNGPAPRRAEAAEVGRIVAKLRASAPTGCPVTTGNVVVLGDWNLPGTDVAFTTLGSNAGFARLQVSPNLLTSVSEAGVRASAYDHFVWDDSLVQVRLMALPAQTLCSTTATVTAGVLNPANLLTFRQRCSDHLGVAATITVR